MATVELPLPERPAPVDRERLCRLFRFIREHEEQARTAEDEVRVDKWERLVNKLLDRMCQVK